MAKKIVLAGACLSLIHIWMTYDCRMGSGEFLSGIRKGLRSGKSLIYVAPDRNQDAAPYLSSLEERSGRRLLALYGEDV